MSFVSLSQRCAQEVLDNYFFCNDSSVYFANISDGSFDVYSQ